MNISLGEFIKFLVLLLHRNQIKLSLRDHRPWHTLLYKLETKTRGQRRPAFLGDLQFDWDGEYPKSLELEEFLDALILNNSVVAINPQLNEYLIPKEIIMLWSDCLGMLEEDATKFLDTALELAKKEFKESGSATRT